MKKGVEKLICIPTQRYDVPSGRIGNPYVGIILVELDGIWNRHWNAERVIFFRQLFYSASIRCPSQEIYVNGLNHILTCGPTVSTISYYRIPTERWDNIQGMIVGTKHRRNVIVILPNLVLRRKLRKAVHFICQRETGGVLLSKERATDRTGSTDKTVAEVLVRKHPAKKKFLVLLWRRMRKCLF